MKSEKIPGYNWQKKEGEKNKKIKTLNKKLAHLCLIH